MKTRNIFLIITIVSAFTLSFGVAYGALTNTIDNSGRREYGFCPISPEIMLSKAEFEINGCPLVRVYISNWDRLTTLEQTTIDTQMRNAGFKDISEFDPRTK